MNTVVALMLIAGVLLMVFGFVLGWIGGRSEGIAEGRAAARREATVDTREGVAA